MHLQIVVNRLHLFIFFIRVAVGNGKKSNISVFLIEITARRGDGPARATGEVE